jgi:hypothetical protein
MKPNPRNSCDFALKTVKGLLILVPPRTPRSMLYVSYMYMSVSSSSGLLLYVYVCYMGGS